MKNGLPANWHDLQDPDDPELDRLAERYHLHPLHIEDCRHRGQIAKLEENGHYLFVVLKPAEARTDRELDFAELDVFLGQDFLITVSEGDCQVLLERVQAGATGLRLDQVFYHLVDAAVDSYLPALDSFDEACDAIEEEVLETPSPVALDRIFAARKSLIDLRRVLTNTRDVASHLQRTQSDLLSRDLWPFWRDVYDHVARNWDTIEVQREILSGALEIYLSSVAQRTNQVMKVLTVLGTIALPSLLITSFYGMNLQGLPWADSPQGVMLAAGVMFALTVVFLAVLRMFRWF